MDSRNRMGKNKDGVIFPAAPNLSEMSDTYLKFIEEVKAEIQKQRISAGIFIVYIESIEFLDNRVIMKIESSIIEKRRREYAKRAI